MSGNSKRPSTKRGRGVWIAADLSFKLKGAQGSRGFRLPQSPYLDLADRFLGTEDGMEPQVSRTTAVPEIHEPIDEPVRVTVAVAPKKKAHAYPKPPAMVPVPKPPRLALPKPPARPSAPRPPRLQVPKPPKRKP